MSRTTKIVIGIVGGLLLLCCLGIGLAALLLPRAVQNFAENSITDDPEQVAEVGQSILDYELPPGMQEEGAMGFAGIKMVFITAGPGNDAMVMLMQFPAIMQANEEEMRRQLEDAMTQQSGQQQFNMEVVSEDEVVINDQNSVLTTLEGTDENGNSIRQITGVFESKAGDPAMLMAISPIAAWEEANIDEFIESLR
jgi:hypothetical protein